LPNVTLQKGHIESEDLLREAMQGMDAVFFNANSFAIGEMRETFWSMRAFEIAIQSGVKFFVYSGLNSALKVGDYDEKYRCGHLDGKSRVSGTMIPHHWRSIGVCSVANNLTEWIQAQPQDRMHWSILTTCPYIEMLNLLWRPVYDEGSDTYIINSPVGSEKIPLIHLDDLGAYARWIFDHTEKSSGKLQSYNRKDILLEINVAFVAHNCSCGLQKQH
jgi:hypothetical protein